MHAANQSGPDGQTHAPAGVSFSTGGGGLPKLNLITPWSTAEIYLHGAHVTHFQKGNAPPLLFLSDKSRFAEHQAIRGGIPIILPWFGARKGGPAHGFARLLNWTLKSLATFADGRIRATFTLPDCFASAFPELKADYLVTVGESLRLELVVTNSSSEQPLIFENCLHTYFAVGDIRQVSITGLKGAQFLDKVSGFSKKTELNDAIAIFSEMDRIYLDTTAPVEIHDAVLCRKIRVEKESSASTVVWNPWSDKAASMTDFGDDEYLRMVCVESGNVAENKIILAPGKTATLAVTLSSLAL